ncbi:hypothetical protein [Pseudidiomarina aestuarii]|uniref:hypothetical protein n=1 Tax=Pseudidiomarina aestuarii TaxID=624146 RepID=UPI003A98426E
MKYIKSRFTLINVVFIAFIIISLPGFIDAVIGGEVFIISMTITFDSQPIFFLIVVSMVSAGYAVLLYAVFIARAPIDEISRQVLQDIVSFRTPISDIRRITSDPIYLKNVETVHVGTAHVKEALLKRVSYEITGIELKEWACFIRDHDFFQYKTEEEESIEPIIEKLCETDEIDGLSADICQSYLTELH